jgi:hypothetical protein
MKSVASLFSSNNILFSVCLAVLALLLAAAAAAQTLHLSQTPAAVLDGRAVLQGHYEPSQMLRLAIALAPPHRAEEQQFLEDVQNKQSPLFHQFLSAGEWNARFGPTEEDEQAVVDWAASQGLTVTHRYANRLIVDVEAQSGVIENAFHVTINQYRMTEDNGPEEYTVFSNDRDPQLPSRLTEIVASVRGLNSVERMMPLSGGGRFVPCPGERVSSQPGDKCGSTGAAPCAPLGNADYPIYAEARFQGAAHFPFYDIVSGCNTNDITSQYQLKAYCATTGYDLVTGWGSANMLQLAWAINRNLTFANGLPYITFKGPAANKWYNTNQIVQWSVNDFAGNLISTSLGTGIAGFSQAWDGLVTDSVSEPHGGTNDLFCTGPQFPNATGGCLSLGPA